MRLVQEIIDSFEISIGGLTLDVPVEAVCVVAHEAFAYHGLSGDIATGHQQSVEIDSLDISWADISIESDEGDVIYVHLPARMKKEVKRLVEPMVIRLAERASAWSEEED